jgi:isoamylase
MSAGSASIASTRAVEPGSSAPLGAAVRQDGVNFSVFSRSATLIELLLFDDRNATKPSCVIPLDANRHRSYHYWHGFVPDIGAGQIYGYRAHGPFKPERGHRFDPEKLLLDPYGLAVAVPDGFSRAAAALPGQNNGTAMKSVVADPGTYDWEGDAPLHRPFAETVIYELHVRGFTRHSSSGVAPESRGTSRGTPTTPEPATR